MNDRFEGFRKAGGKGGFAVTAERDVPQLQQFVRQGPVRDGRSRNRPLRTKARVWRNSAAMAGTSSGSPVVPLRCTSQYTQRKLQSLSGFILIPTDKPRARGETTA
jgi:hypothetical protein